MPQIIPAKYDEGQTVYNSGGSLRTLLANCLAATGSDNDDALDEAVSSLIGFADAIVTSIRRIDNQLMGATRD